MLFSSNLFIYLFAPIVILLAIFFPRKFQNLILFVASLFFYAWGEYSFVSIIVSSILVNYFLSLIIQKHTDQRPAKAKLILAGSICFNLGLLVYFKYTNFLLSEFSNLETNIHLPLGISFFTFQSISYLVDISTGKVKVQKNILNYGLYIAFFPQLIAGPIIRYVDVVNQITHRIMNMDSFVKGTQRFIKGLIKKIIIANNVAIIADSCFNQTQSQSVLMAWLGAVCYMLQIYFDFSGYSDMAIGLGRIFGFKFNENFNHPYEAKSIRDFWRRWHISLSKWFRDYLYIPLGGSKVSNLNTYRNLGIVFVCTGLWHGANWTFLFWGLYHGIFIILERIGLENFLRRLPKVFQHTYAVFVVIIGWVIFRANSMHECGVYLKDMFDLGGTLMRPEDLAQLDKFNITIICLGIFLSFDIKKRVSNMLTGKDVTFEVFSQSIIGKNVYNAGLLAGYVVCLSFLASQTYNPFIYFRF